MGVAKRYFVGVYRTNTRYSKGRHTKGSQLNVERLGMSWEKEYRLGPGSGNLRIPSIYQDRSVMTTGAILWK